MANPTERLSYPLSSYPGAGTEAIRALAVLAVQKPKLPERVRRAILVRRLGPRTEQAYSSWIKRFKFFHNKRHPVETAETEIGRFLSIRGSRGIRSRTRNQKFWHCKTRPD